MSMESTPPAMKRPFMATHMIRGSRSLLNMKTGRPDKRSASGDPPSGGNDQSVRRMRRDALYPPSIIRSSLIFKVLLTSLGLDKKHERPPVSAYILCKRSHPRHFSGSAAILAAFFWRAGRPRSQGTERLPFCSACFQARLRIEAQLTITKERQQDSP